MLSWALWEHRVPSIDSLCFHNPHCKPWPHLDGSFSTISILLFHEPHPCWSFLYTLFSKTHAIQKVWNKTWMEGMGLAWRHLTSSFHKIIFPVWQNRHFWPIIKDWAEQTVIQNPYKGIWIALDKDQGIIRSFLPTKQTLFWQCLKRVLLG